MLTLRTPLLAVALALTAGLSQAQTPLGGNVFDGSGGPLVSGTVYHSTSNIAVPAGETLTIPDDVVIKFTAATHQLNVSGTLDVSGTSGNPVILTSIHDDTAGGDTNGNGGATTPVAGNWRGLSFTTASDASTLDWLEVRYTGNAAFEAIDLNGADITMSNCTLRDGLDDALTLTANSFPSVSNCTFTNHAIAVNDVDMDAVPGFSSNSASGNAGNYMRITGGQLDASATFTTDNMLAGALVNGVNITIPAGVTLALEPGVVFKPTSVSNQWTVSGTLDVNGTAADPVVFTSFKDDTAGGDTNGDGAASLPLPADWRGLVFTTASDASTLDWLEVRYTGNASFEAIDLNQADITMSNCTLRDGSDGALMLNANSFPSVSSCTFTNHAIAVESVDMDAVTGFSGNSASGNAGNYMLVTGTQLDASATFTADNVLAGALVHNGNITIPAGVTLALEPGVVFKPSVVSNQWTVSGTLDVNGTAAEPVVITSFRDDTAGGDTNGDGAASLPLPADWRGLVFASTSDASTLDWLEVRYTGSSAFEAVDLNQADIAMSHCTLRDGLGDAMTLNANSFPTVRDSTISGFSGLAVDDVRLDAVPGFSFNQASGTGGNYMHVTFAAITTNVVIEEHNVLEGALVSSVNLSVDDPGILELGAGVVMKLSSATIQLTHSGGTLRCNGTLARPVVFTSIRDDARGGDTNGDGGSTSPMAGDWRGILIGGSSTIAGNLTNTVIRYPGNASFEGLDCSGLMELDGVRVDFGAADGFLLSSFGSATRLCAFGNAGDGFELPGGGTLTRCTAVDNATGFRSTGSVMVRDSIGWGNAVDFSGFTASDLFYSNGDSSLSGMNGNIDADPLFVDQLNGDLRLTAASPSVDTGDPLAEQDPDCTRRDMGAQPYDQGGPSTYCTAKLNSQGCTPFVDFLGYPSATDADAFTITGNDVLNNKSGLFFYGYQPHGGTFQGGTKCVLNPVKRTPVQDSGGDPLPNNCSGTYALDFNARIQSGIDTGLVPGADVFGQFWSRDPTAPFTTGLTNGIRFTICP